MLEDSNEYLSYVYDHGYFLKFEKKIRTIFDESDRDSFVFYLTSGSKKVKFGELKYDIIPFYEYLLRNYNIGVFIKTVSGDVCERFSTLQFYNSNGTRDVIKLQKMELLNDNDIYDDKLLACISFYIKIN